MRKLLTSFLTALLILGGVCVNTYALSKENVVEPRAQIFEAEITKAIPVKNASGKQIGTLNTKCTATLRNVNGKITIDSYRLTATSKSIGTTKVSATVVNKASSGLVISVNWKVKAQFATIPPQIVYTTSLVMYDFN
ncbi:hypothetical protein [Massilimicrobiota timonensis]|uniref:hypothetical protein n=1 Tax=Massilimicrobiota timonensis TaxID=1776392 RepID=UPI001961DE31|nr:hypothetical protein [Massilimicrobiota timonensis]MBM6966693.1 hypothetical protein [Massilimicrobiota timonensis]